MKKTKILAFSTTLITAALLFIGGVLAAGTVISRNVSAATTYIVDDDLACPGATYSTISAAVAAASAGDTIQVCAGTYNELVNVNKTLTIVGAQSGVDARTRTGAPGTESVVNSTGTPGFDVGFNVTAGGVVIDGFTVQDASTVGIYLVGTSSGYQILNNIIQNNTFGLYLNSSGGTQTLVQNNAFKTNNLPGSASGDAIYSDQGASNVLIDANSFTGHASASMVFVGTQSNITVSGNQLPNDNTMVFLNTNGLTITGNTITNPVGSAIFLGGGNNNVSITCNIIAGSPFNGISVSNPFGVGPNTNVSINDNNIQGNVGAGLRVSSTGYTGTLNAENNYWGSPTGPTTPENPGGTGDKIIAPTGVVDFTPFRTAPISDVDNDGVLDTCDSEVGPPTNKDQCKKGGWEMFNSPRTFKNQGDCIQFVNTGK